MLIAVAKIDGLNVALFHVEQSPDGPWEWRMRLSGDDWRDPVPAKGRFVQAEVLHATRAFDVQWRMKDDVEWQDASPHEFGDAACEFIVKAALPYDHIAGASFVVCGMVHGFTSVWVLDFPVRKIAVDGEEILHVTGSAAKQGLGQVLLKAGDFQCQEHGFSVINSSASQAALLPVSRCEVGIMDRRGGSWAVKTGSLPQNEIEELKKEMLSWPV